MGVAVERQRLGINLVSLMTVLWEEGRCPEDDVVPVGLCLPVLAAALGGQPQLSDGGAVRGV